MSKIKVRVKGTKVQIGPCETDFVWLDRPFVPTGVGEKEGKYHITVMWPKSDVATTEAVNGAVAAALAEGDRTKWPKGRPRRLESPVKDGDEREKDPYGIYKGKMYISAKSARPVPVVGRDKMPLLDLAGQTWSGMEAVVEIGLFPYAVTGNAGVGAGLNIVMKTGDGQRRGGGQTDASTFDGFEIDEADDDDL